MTLQFGVYDINTGILQYDWTNIAQGLTFSTDEHGYESLQAFIPLSIQDAFIFYDAIGTARIELNEGNLRIWEGRLEDVEITNNGINITALGFWQILSDFPATQFFSYSGVADWREVTKDEITDVNKDAYTTDNNNRLYITANKNAAISFQAGRMIYEVPSAAQGEVNGIEFDYVFAAPNSNWLAGVQPVNSAGSIYSTTLQLLGNAGVQSGTINLNVAAGATKITVYLYYNGSTTVTQETGTIYFKITNVRIVSSTFYRTLATLTSGVGAGSNITLNLSPINQTDKIYVGQKLQLESTLSLTERVTVVAVNSPTQIVVAQTSNAYPIGSALRGYVVFADAIVNQGVINFSNVSVLNPSLQLIQNPMLDLFNEVYEDMRYSEIFERLANYGDRYGRKWEVGVWDNRMVHFRPRGSEGRTWYIDIADIHVQRSLSEMYNWTYTKHKRADGFRQIGTIYNDTTSIAKYGVQRVKVVEAETTSVLQANTIATTSLTDTKDPDPRASFTISRIYDENFGMAPLYYVRAGDTLIIRNLAPSLSNAIDKIRIFRVTHTTFNADGTLTIEPEKALPSLETIRVPDGGAYDFMS